MEKGNDIIDHTKLKKHIVSDCRIIEVFPPKYDHFIKFKVSTDFIPAEEWMEEILEDPYLAECKEFLKQKRFTQDEDGRWSNRKGYGSAIRLPEYFLDKENRRLRVKFGSVSCRLFGIPELYNGYASLDELPTDLLKQNGKRGHLTTSIEKDEYENIGTDTSLAFNSYNKHYGELTHESDKEENVNCQYYSLILKFHAMMMLKKDDTHGSTQVLEANKEFFESDEDYLRIEERELRLLKSNERIEKFNL